MKLGNEAEKSGNGSEKLETDQKNLGYVSVSNPSVFELFRLFVESVKQ